jgi:gliding motility-associated-like protein
MKNLYKSLMVLGICFYSFAAIAQTERAKTIITPQQWDEMKQAGTLTNEYTMWNAQTEHPEFRPKIQASNPVIGHEKNFDLCSCFQTMDSTWAVVPFNGYSGPDYRNDDGSSPLTTIPFNFCFYGGSYNQVYINNNGNISFDSPYSTFSPVGLQQSAEKMVAPFWADVDTRNALSGIVHYKLTATALIVRWDSVGYFATHVDKVASFQCIITDGTDPLVPNGNNVKFCYAQMQWTTGDASLDSAGFCAINGNGYPAVVGASNADNVNFVQFGQFGRPGGAYGGPFDPYPYSGIDWLDNQSFIFSTCSGNNIPPIMVGLSYCDTIRVCAGDTTIVPVHFLSPEINQITHDTAWSAMTGFSILSQITDTTASITVQIIPDSTNYGLNTITFMAIDNGNPNDTTIVTLYVTVDSFNLAKPTTNPHGLILCPNAIDTIWVNNPPQYNSYLWSNGATTDTIAVGPGIYKVTVTSPNGCHAYSADTLIPVPNSVPVITGLTHHCPQDSVLLTTGSFPTYTWSNGSTSQSIWVDAGTFTVTVHDTNGCVGTSLPFTVTNTGPTPTTHGNSPVCGTDSATIYVTPSFSTYSWSNGGTTDTIKVGAGTYFVTCTDTAGCVTRDSFIVVSNPNPIPTISGTPTYCGNTGTVMTANPSGLTSYLWSNGSNTEVTNLTTGFYTVTVTDANGCKGIDTVTITGYPNPTPVVTGDSAFCANDTVTLTVNPAYTSYSWSDGETTQSIKVSTTGTWTVTVTDSHGCVGISQAFNTTAYPAPVAYFTINPPGSSRPDSLIHFYDSSYDTNGNIVYYLWYFGDGDSTSMIQNPTHIYQVGGVYKVELIVVSDNGCRDTMWSDYLINVLQVIAPNVFTPNGDGKNDFLVFTNLTDYPNDHLIIYNRWGIKLYDNPDYKNDWTGDNHPDGTYYYILHIGDTKGTILKGTIEIIRNH